MAFLRRRFVGLQGDKGEEAATTPSSEASSSYSTSSSSAASSATPRNLCIAIIGSGLTGLSAAHFLLSDDHEPGRSVRPMEVHLFERAKKIGLDSNSISIYPYANGGDAAGEKESIRVDVPMRSLNAGYYPSVIQLYRRLRIPLKRTDFTYSFATSHAPIPPPSLHQTASANHPGSSLHAPSPDILYEGSSGLKGFSIPHALRTIPKIRQTSPGSRSATLKRRELVASRWYTIPFYLISIISNSLGILSYAYSCLLFLLAYIHLLLLAVWHHSLGHTRDPNHPLASRSLQSHFPSSKTKDTRAEQFLEKIVAPLFSAMMTVQASSVLSAPIAEVLDYVALTFGRSHYTVASGVQEVEEAIARPIPKGNIHVDCQVTRLTRHGKRVDVEVIESGEEVVYEGFDHVVLATQANQSASFVDSYVESLVEKKDSDEKRRLKRMGSQLRLFSYEDSEVVNHVDRTLLPKEEGDWRDLNLVTPTPQPGGSLLAGKHLSEKIVESSASLGQDEIPPISTLSSNTHTMASHIIHRSHSPWRFPCDSNQDPMTKETELEGRAEKIVIQTTNPLSHLYPRKDSILSISRFERAVLTLRSKQGQAGLFEWHRKSLRGARKEGSGREKSGALTGEGLNRLEAKEEEKLGWTCAWAWAWATSLRHTLYSLLPVAQWEMRIGNLQGRGTSTEQGPGIWVCGSWSPGIPLLEGCVVSSRLVVQALLCEEEEEEEEVVHITNTNKNKNNND